MNFKNATKLIKTPAKIQDTLDKEVISAIKDIVPNATYEVADDKLTVTSPYEVSDWSHDLLTERLSELGWGFATQDMDGIHYQKASQPTIADSISKLVSMINPKNSKLLKVIK